MLFDDNLNFTIVFQFYNNLDEQKKARKALQWLRGPNADVTQEFNEIEKANQANKSQDPPTFTTIFNRMYVRPLLISLGLMFFQQMSGINAYMFYTVKIFQVYYLFYYVTYVLFQCIFKYKEYRLTFLIFL